MHYICPDCHRPIGLMANKDGQPEMFKCIYTGRAQPKQNPIRREIRHPVRVSDDA